MIVQPCESKERDAQKILSGLIGQEDTLQCIRCGLCSYNCPVYRSVLCESQAPRGRVALLRAVAEGKLAPSDLFSNKFYDCVLCAACSNACPSGMEVDRVLLEARKGLYEADLAPTSLVQLSGMIGEAHNISGDDNAGRLLWTENMERAPSGSGRADAEIVYFVGCVGSFFPMSYSIPQAFVSSLDEAEIEYALLGGEEWCCGYPALIAGDHELAKRMAEHNVAAVRRAGASQVTVTCPSCYHMWTHTYPQLLDDAMEDITVLHAAELLARLIEEGQLPVGRMEMRVTYHDPCDLGRKSGLYEPPRQVLRAIPGVELVEMRSNRADSLCCGGGGNVETTHPELVEKMAARRLGQAQDVEAQAIVTSCQQCKRTLTAAARRERVRIRTLDITEIVLKAVESAREMAAEGCEG